MQQGDRWWVDVEKAQRVLSIVGGDDVAQSVGTVALAYHAQLAGQLRALSTTTLTDRADIAELFDDIDLAPVTKAMSAAVSPLLGSAAPAYAEDLVATVHQEAREGIAYELQVLTSKNVPWVQAVERVCGVAGVPARAINGYVQKMSAPQVNPKVMTDEADRALMTWASRLGRREATPVIEGAVIAKAGSFQEREHPRGDDGEFIQAGDAPRTGDPRTERIARIARIARLQGKASQAQAARAQQEQELAASREAELAERRQKKSLAELQDEVLNRRASPRRAAARQQDTRRQSARVQSARQQDEQAPKEKAKPAKQVEHVPRAASAAADGYRVHEKVYIDLPPDALAGKDVNEIVSAEELKRHGDVTIKPKEQQAGMKRYEIDSAYVIHDHNDGSYELDRNYQYVVDGAGFGGPNGWDPVIRLRPLEPGEDGRVTKAGAFDEREHPRGADGEFVTGEPGGQSPRRARIERIARIARHKAAADQRAQEQARQSATEQEAARQEPPAEAQRAAAGVLRRAQPRQAQVRQQSPRRAAARQQDTRQAAARVAPAAMSEHERQGAHDANILGEYKTALALDDFQFSFITDQYGADLAGEAKPFQPPDEYGVRTPNEIKTMLHGSKMMNTDEVAGDFLSRMGNAIKSQPHGMAFDLLEDGSLAHFQTKQEAIREAKHLLAGAGDTVWDEQGGRLVPGVARGPSGTYTPVGIHQAANLRSDDDVPDAPRNLFTGEDAAMMQLRNGDTRNLLVRLVHQGASGEQLAAMGGGDPYKHGLEIEPDLDVDVYEVTFAPDNAGKRRPRRA